LAVSSAVRATVKSGTSVVFYSVFFS